MLVNLSEIRDDSNLNLTNYNLFNQIGKCPGHSHCGLLIYVHEDFKCNELIINQIIDFKMPYVIHSDFICFLLLYFTILEGKCFSFANLQFDLNLQTTRKIYRRANRFIEEFEIFLTIIKRYKKFASMCGDFNINFLEINNNRRFNTYFESMIAKGFQELLYEQVH